MSGARRCPRALIPLSIASVVRILDEVMEREVVRMVFMW